MQKPSALEIEPRTIESDGASDFHVLDAAASGGVSCSTESSSAGDARSLETCAVLRLVAGRDHGSHIGIRFLPHSEGHRRPAAEGQHLWMDPQIARSSRRASHDYRRRGGWPFILGIVKSFLFSEPISWNCDSSREKDSLIPCNAPEASTCWRSVSRGNVLTVCSWAEIHVAVFLSFRLPDILKPAPWIAFFLCQRVWWLALLPLVHPSVR